MLKVENISFAFGSRPLFGPVSFELAPGGLVRLSGQNGTGKTTLMMLIAGLKSYATGKIIFEGSDEDDQRSWTSWLPADANALDPNMSAVDNLRFWLDLRQNPLSEETVLKVLIEWGLSGDYRTKILPVGLFSTGMKRRLSLARLSLSHSTLWLLDEPLFGLDDAACTKFRVALSSHLAAGGGAVVITHDDRLLRGLPVQTVDLTPGAMV